MPDRPFLTTVPLPVRGYDVDFGGVVSNLVAVRWLDDLRTALIDRVAPMRDLLESGRVPVVARLEVDYRRPIRLFDAVEGRVWVEAAGRTSLELAAEIVRPSDESPDGEGSDGEGSGGGSPGGGSPGGAPLVYVAARQRAVFVDAQTGRPVPVPDALRPPDA